MRTYLRQCVADEAALVTAYSLDSVLIETMFIVGPLLVALFVAFSSAAIEFAAVEVTAEDHPLAIGNLVDIIGQQSKVYLATNNKGHK